MFFSTILRQAATLGCHCLVILMVLAAASPIAWGQADAKQPQAAVAKPADTKDNAWIRVNDEPRELSGIIIGAIIVNLTLVVIFFWLLLREWKKHQVKNTGAPASQTKKA